MNQKSKKRKTKNINQHKSSIDKNLVGLSAEEKTKPIENSLDVNKLNSIANYLEKIQFQEYIDYRLRPWRMIRVNLFAGMAKGLGFALGFTVLAFFAFYILRKLQVLDLPFLGNFIADLLEYIDEVRGVNLY